MKLDPNYEFPAGFYYVGDLCYYLQDDEWDVLLTVSNIKDGIYRLPDGRVFAWYGTAWGDGEYYDQYGRQYGVDSGTIGLIQVPPETGSPRGGQVIEFRQPFTTNGTDEDCRKSGQDGVIRFGPVKIDTNPEYEENEEETY